jgi:hypothetical protein
MSSQKSESSVPTGRVKHPAMSGEAPFVTMANAGNVIQCELLISSNAGSAIIRIRRVMRS